MDTLKIGLQVSLAVIKMLVTIDEKYEQSLIQGGLSDEEFDFIIDLFSEMEKGKLFFLCNHSFYKYILNTYSKRISSRVFYLIKRLVNDEFVNISEAKRIKPLITICDLNTKEVHKDGTYFISYKSFPKNCTPYLCSENISDASFYLDIFKIINTHKSSVILMKEACGGSDVGSVLESFFTEGRIFLYIGDSDIKYPNADEGNTAQKVREVFNNNHLKTFSTYYILKVHEKENLIPLKYYKNLSKNISKVIDYLLSLNSEQHIIYFDITDGISMDDYRGMCNKCDDWKYIYSDVIHFIEQEKLYNKQKNCKKFFTGVGKKALATVTNNLEEKELKWLLSTTQKKDLDNISELLLKYGYTYSIMTN